MCYVKTRLGCLQLRLASAVYSFVYDIELTRVQYLNLSQLYVYHTF